MKSDFLEHSVVIHQAVIPVRVQSTSIRVQVAHEQKFPVELFLPGFRGSLQQT